MLTCHSNITTGMPWAAPDPASPTNIGAPILVAYVEAPICQDIIEYKQTLCQEENSGLFALSISSVMKWWKLNYLISDKRTLYMYFWYCKLYKYNMLFRIIVMDYYTWSFEHSRVSVTYFYRPGNNPEHCQSSLCMWPEKNILKFLSAITDNYRKNK